MAIDELEKLTNEEFAQPKRAKIDYQDLIITSEPSSPVNHMPS